MSQNRDFKKRDCSQIRPQHCARIDQATLPVSTNLASKPFNCCWLEGATDSSGLLGFQIGCPHPFAR